MQQNFINLLYNAFQKQPSLGSNESMAHIEHFLSTPDSIPVLLAILNNPEINDAFIIKACLTFLFQTIRKFILSDLQDTIIPLIQQIFELYKRDIGFQNALLVHEIIKLIINVLKEENNFSNILMDMLMDLAQNNRIDLAAILAKTVLHHFPVLTADTFQFFHNIAILFFQNFSGDEFYNSPNINEEDIIRNTSLLTKSIGIFDYLFEFKRKEIEAITKFTINFGSLVYFVPIALITKFIKLGSYVNNLPEPLYKKFWMSMSGYLEDFFLIAIRIGKGQLTPQIIQIVMPANIDLSPEKYKLLESTFFKCCDFIYRNDKVSLSAKYLPYEEISQYILQFPLKIAQFIFQKEIMLTYLSVLHNMNQFEYFKLYAACFKNFLVNTNRGVDIYKYFRKIIFEKLLKMNPQNTIPAKITIVLYLSLAIKKIPWALSNDLEFINHCISSCFESRSNSQIYAALKCLRNLSMKRNELTSFFWNIFQSYIPAIQECILSDDMNIYWLALETYTNCVDFSQTIDYEFLMRNGEILKEKSPQHYYLFLSLYFTKTENYDPELMSSLITNSIPLLQRSFLDVDFSECLAMISILSCIFECMKRDEVYYESVWPTFHLHFGFFTNKVLNDFVNMKNVNEQLHFFQQHFLYMFRISILISNFAIYFCSNLAKIYTNLNNDQFLLECAVSVWNFLPLLMKLNFRTTNAYTNQLKYLFEEVSKSMKELMSDQQIVEYAKQFFGVYTKNESHNDQDSFCCLLYVFNSLMPGLVRSNDEQIYLILKQIISSFLEYIGPFLMADKQRYVIDFPNIVETFFEKMPPYCLSIQKDQSLANLFLNTIYHETHNFLYKTIDMNSISNPFHKICFNNFTLFNDLIEALMSAPGFAENGFWINLYLKACKNCSDEYLYFVIDTFIKAIQKQSIPIELHDQISSVVIEKVALFFKTPSTNFLSILQNSVFLLHRLIFLNQNQIALNFVVQNMNNFLMARHFFTDNSVENQVICLKDDIASLYLCLACFVPDLDIQILNESIDFFIPTDETELENFLNYFLAIANPNNNSPYYQAIYQKIFQSLAILFSSSFCSQMDLKFPDHLRDQCIALFFQILQSAMPDTMNFINSIFQDKPRELARINSFIQFYSSLNSQNNSEENNSIENNKLNSI